MELKFKEWLKAEMTTTAATGGGTSTADIANFSRPIFTEPVRRKNPRLLNDVEKKRMKLN